MKEKLENITFKHNVTLFTFFLFFFLCLLSPISGDDWKSYIIGKEGIVECFSNIDFSDGRILSGFLINFLSYNKIFFNFIFAYLISQFVKICNDLMGTVKTKYLYLYPVIGVLLVSTFMFSYNYMSVTSAVAYTFPIILFFMFFYQLLKDEEINRLTFFKLLLIAIYICLSSIHIAITFFIANLIYFIADSKKKIDAKTLTFLIIEFILVLVSINFIDDTIIYTDYKAILGNINFLIDRVFSNNIILIIVGAIPINFYLNEKLKDNTYKRVVITLFDMILVFSLAYNFFYYSPVNLNLVLSKYSGIFATENWYYIIYFFTYMVLFVLSMNYYIKNRKLHKTLNIFTTSSLIVMIFLLISPIFDRGNIVFIIFTIVLTTCILAKEMNTKVYIKIAKLSVVLLTVYYVSMFGIIKYIDNTRTDYIEEQLDTIDTNIEVKANPLYLVWRYNPVDYFQIKDFKKFYDIPEIYTIEVKYFGIFEQIEKKVKENDI